MTPSLARLARTTHLAIGAHADDLEFMAYHGIATCYQNPDCWFTGIICSDGAGSVQGQQADPQLITTRHQEQLQAARIGDYNAIFQLGYSSQEMRPAPLEPLVAELTERLLQCKPEVLYAHNPADRHATHLATLAATLAAVRRLPQEERPQTFLGCEVWRDLDWLPEDYCVALDVSPYPELSAKLNNCFTSQTAGGKNYPAAVEGRRLAHATFHQSHESDDTTHLSYALDLTPLLQDDSLTLRGFMSEILETFQAEILTPLV